MIIADSTEGSFNAFNILYDSLFLAVDGDDEAKEVRRVMGQHEIHYIKTLNPKP